MGSSIVTPLKLYCLVRRLDMPNEENLIVGTRVSPTTVKVYKYQEARKGYVFLKICKDADLKYTGRYEVGKYSTVPPLLENVT